MATVEFINKRIAGKIKEIEKLEKKRARILAAKSTDWTKNPYYYSEIDLKYVERDLLEANKQLENYQAQLVAESEKAASRNVPAILNFLESWKNRVYNFYYEDINDYFSEWEALHQEYSRLSNKYGPWEISFTEEGKDYQRKKSELYSKLRGYYEKQEFVKNGKTYHKDVKVADGEWEHIAHYITRGKTTQEVMDYIKKELDKEADRKYDFIIERVNEICGTIKDASSLRVGAKDDLNGIIVGERGNAQVQTIGAGGYNIQCFHFRTLVHKA